MKTNLRFRFLATFTALAVVPLLLVNFILASRNYSDLERQSFYLQTEIARNVSNEVENFLSERLKELGFLERVINFENQELQYQKVILQNLLAYQRHYQEIHLYDGQGNGIFHLSRSESNQLLLHRTKDSFQEYRGKANRTIAGEVRFDNGIQEPLMEISIPLRDKRTGKVIHIVEVTLRFKAVWDLLTEIVLPYEGGAVYILAASGEVIAHQNPSIALGRKTFILPPGSRTGKGLSGNEVVFGTAPVNLLDQSYTVVVEQPASVAYLIARENRNFTFAAALIALGMAALFMFSAVRRIILPIEKIAHAAKAISAGDMDHKLETEPGDEIHDLAQAFNHMASEIGKALYELRIEIAERKNIEEMLRELNEELEERVAQRTGELKAANTELESFAYSVSHDLRAPLRAIDGFSRALEEDLDGDLPVKASNHLVRVRQNVKRMGQLIDDLLNLSRVTRTVLNSEEVNLTALVSDIVSGLEEREPERKIQIFIEENMTTTGDPRLLEVAFSNILGNAWKFTSKRDDGEIRVGTMRYRGEMVFYVKDNGAGFDMAYVNKLFNPFQRLHGVSEYPGTGIGLATVKRVVERHGGKVFAEAQVNEGATIYVRLERPLDVEEPLMEKGV